MLRSTAYILASKVKHLFKVQHLVNHLSKSTNYYMLKQWTFEMELQLLRIGNITIYNQAVGQAK